MRIIIGIMIGAAMLPAMAVRAATASPVSSAEDKEIERQRRVLDEGMDLIRAGKPAEAIKRFDRVNAYYEKAYAGEKRRIYCSRSMVETLLYMGMAGSQKEDAVAIASTWCDAVFLKGFALIDLGRRTETRVLLERAIEMAPSNSQYLAEFAEFRKADHDWKGALELFEQAESAAEFAGDGDQPRLLARALRGQGFVLIELGELDKAEALFQRCLKLDPNDDKARGELQYIEEQRNRKKAAT